MGPFPMKIAVLADIHGNDIALAEVLAEAQRLDVARLFFLGDLVGYYHRAAKVARLLDEWDVVVVQGNHDAMLAQVAADPSGGTDLVSKYGSAIRSAVEQLPDAWMHRLAAAPHCLAVDVGHLRFELCHGSPWNRDAYIYPDAPVESLERCTVVGADFVLMGHTHRPMVRAHGRTLLVNPGSVGQARDRGGIASWAIIDTTNGAVLPKATPYDPTGLLEEAAVRDPGVPYLREVLLRK